MGFISALRRRRGRTTLSIALGLVLLAAVATSQATHLSTDTEGHTTVDQTICAQDPATSGCLPDAARNPAPTTTFVPDPASRMRRASSTPARRPRSAAAPSAGAR